MYYVFKKYVASSLRIHPLSLSIYLSIYLSIFLSFYLSIYIKIVLYIYLYVQRYMYMYTMICICVYIYACMSIHMHLKTCVCIYTYIYIVCVYIVVCYYLEQLCHICSLYVTDWTKWASCEIWVLGYFLRPFFVFFRQGLAGHLFKTPQDFQTRFLNTNKIGNFPNSLLGVIFLDHKGVFSTT